MSSSSSQRDIFDTSGIANGFEESYFLTANHENIKTGIQSFDRLLIEKNLQGRIIELCGASGSGKTQFCYTFMINTVQKHDCEVLFINTKCDFNLERFLKIVENINGNDQQHTRDKLLKNIRIENIFTAVEFVHCLRLLCIKVKKYFRNLKLIVIDSLPPLFLCYKHEENEKKITLLLTAAKLLRKIAYEHQLIVFVVNFTKDHNLSAQIENLNKKMPEDEPDLQDEDINYEKEVDNEVDELTQALGKNWFHIPAYRFLIEDTTETSCTDKFTECRKIVIWNGLHLVQGNSCFVKITDSGVV